MGSSYMFPVLWASVFTPDDIRTRILFAPVPSEQTTAEVYPIVLAPSATVRERALARQAAFDKIFPARCSPYYAKWLALLDTVDAPYLWVDTRELWWMEEADGRFAQDLEAPMRAFDGDPEAMAQLLDQTYGLRYEPSAQRVRVLAEQEANVRFDLHGYEWMRPVPWQEDDEESPSS